MSFIKNDTKSSHTTQVLEPAKDNFFSKGSQSAFSGGSKESGGFWDIDTESNDISKKSVPYVTGFGKDSKKYFPYLELKKAIDKNDSSCIVQDYLNEVNNE